MAAFIFFVVVILSTAVVVDTGASSKPIDVDTVAPPLPENVAACDPFSAFRYTPGTSLPTR